MIEILEIQQKCKPDHVSIVHPDDFAVLPGGHAEPEYLVRNPHVSPYCLDDTGQRVIFVETPADVDIASYPFFYDAQYQHAQRLFAVPYATMIALAEALPPAGTPLVLIYTPGRSGSTLLSKAFQETGSITSLSEPDIYTQVVALRALDSTRDPELTALLTSITKLLFKPSYVGDTTLWVLKFRSFCIELADMLSARLLDVKNIFLYRDLRGWTQSMMRLIGTLDVTGDMTTALEPLVRLLGPIVKERGAENITPIEVATLMWLSTMHRYLELTRQGFAMHTLRFEELTADPRRTLEAVFQYVGIDAGLVNAAVRAFDRDSQEGSMLSREAVSLHSGVVSSADWARVRALVDQFPWPADGAPISAEFAVSAHI